MENQMYCIVATNRISKIRKSISDKMVLNEALNAFKGYNFKGYKYPSVAKYPYKTKQK